jgi:GNAT superfamily N-acetyltransferase
MNPPAVNPPATNPPGVLLRRGWIKGALGWVIAEHGRYYETYWKLGAVFEAKVAGEIGEWMARYDPARDLLLLAGDDNGILGAIILDGSGPNRPANCARIRFFIMTDRARGRGVGRLLMQGIMDFAQEAGFNRIFLTTFRGLDAARRLYEDFGFQMTDEHLDTTWGTPLWEQRFDWERA